jgi:hypothetical protein
VQALIPDTPSLVVEIDPLGASTQACDLRFRGVEPDAEVIEQIADMLTRRQILNPVDRGR